MTYRFYLLTIFIVFVFYMHTLNYPWRQFDENIFFDETLLPIPQSFTGIFEYIGLFGLNQHFEAASPIYTNIVNVRCSPVNNFILFFIFFLFQKNALAYHLASLFLHLINTSILYWIINKISRNGQAMILTLLWALHPVNVESVLFTTNITALINYSICMGIFFYFVNTEEKQNSLIASAILFILYLFGLFNGEQIITLPLILITYIFAKNTFRNKNISKSFIFAIKKTMPLFLVLGIFFVYFCMSGTKLNLSLLNTSPIVTLERIFWFSPQIFFHLAKLTVLPFHLTIDQMSLVKLSETLFAPYAIFCLLFMFLFVFLIVISLIFAKRNIFYLITMSFTLYFVALLPFLHIISPIYNLTSERYLYFPLLMLVFGMAHAFHQKGLINQTPTTKIVLVILLAIYSTRGYIRTFDWKDSPSLFISAYKENNTTLTKAARLLYVSNLSNNHSEEAQNILKDLLVEQETKIQKYQKNTPQIIKFYGLDPLSIQARAAFLLGFTELNIKQNPHGALENIRPYKNNLNIFDSQVILFLYRTFFLTKNMKEAEEFLTGLIEKGKISPYLFVAYSDFVEYKYNNLKETEKLLLCLVSKDFTKN